jgi:hypothetical protein
MANPITYMNLAEAPAGVLIQPRLGELKMLDFDQVEHTIEEGYIGVKFTAGKGILSFSDSFSCPLPMSGLARSNPVKEKIEDIKTLAEKT